MKAAGNDSSFPGVRLLVIAVLLLASSAYPNQKATNQPSRTNVTNEPSIEQALVVPQFRKETGIASVSRPKP